MEVRQEIMQLRSANNALEFTLQQKDLLIEQLTEEAKKNTQAQELKALQKEFVLLKKRNDDLEEYTESLNIQKIEVEEELEQLKA